MKIEKPYAGGKWTKARFFGFLRSALRLASRKWPPRHEAKNAVRRPYVGTRPRQRWEYECAMCGKWFQGTEVEVDHIEPCGQLKEYDDLPGFVRRLFCEASELRVTCKSCHRFLTECQAGRK